MLSAVVQAVILPNLIPDVKLTWFSIIANLIRTTRL